MGATNRQNMGRGFWLSEVLIGIWLLTFIGASLIATFVFLAKGTQVSSERAAAELLAGNLVQQAVRAGPPLWGQPALGGTVTRALGDSASPTRFTWVITPTEVESARLGTLFRVRVEVEWIDREGGDTGLERGRGNLTRERYVYVEDI